MTPTPFTVTFGGWTFDRDERFGMYVGLGPDSDGMRTDLYPTDEDWGRFTAAVHDAEVACADNNRLLALVSEIAAICHNGYDLDAPDPLMLIEEAIANSEGGGEGS